MRWVPGGGGVTRPRGRDGRGDGPRPTRDRGGAGAAGGSDGGDPAGQAGRARVQMGGARRKRTTAFSCVDILIQVQVDTFGLTHARAHARGHPPTGRPADASCVLRSGATHRRTDLVAHST